MAHEQKEFWSTVAQKYDRVVDLQIGGTTRSMVHGRVMKEERLGEVVEFGCGTGFYTQALVTRADRVTATDIVPAILAMAKERINTSNVTFQLEDCQARSFSDEAFDTAFIVKPPRAFGKHSMTEKQLCNLLVKSSFSPRTSH